MLSFLILLNSLCSVWHSGSFSPSWNAPCLGYLLVSLDDSSSSAHTPKRKCPSGLCLPLLLLFAVCLFSFSEFHALTANRALLSGLDSQMHIFNTNLLPRSKSLCNSLLAPGPPMACGYFKLSIPSSASYFPFTLLANRRHPIPLPEFPILVKYAPLQVT